jgi:hypothetical protein
LSDEVEGELVMETVEVVATSPGRDETGDTADSEEKEPVTELLVQLGRDVSALAFCEAQLAASRNMPEVRRAARDLAGAVVAAVAFVTAFAFANVAALWGLSNVLSGWLAALVLGAAWLAVVVALLLALMVRAGHATAGSGGACSARGPKRP